MTALNFLMEAERSYHFGHWLQVSKNSSGLWFSVHFFMILYMYLYPLGRSRQPIVNRKTSSLWSFVASLKKISSTSAFIYTSFHDLINVYSRTSAADKPQGTKFWCQQKPLVTSVICYKFKTHLFEVGFYTHLFMILYMYIAPGRGLATPWEQNVDVNRNILPLGHVLQVPKTSLWSLILWTFVHDFIHVRGLSVNFWNTCILSYTQWHRHIKFSVNNDKLPINLFCYIIWR